MSLEAYNPIVAARTRTAEFIKGDHEVLTQFTDLGGLASDLDVIINQGHAAREANSGQSAAAGVTAGAVLDADGAFTALQHEYKAVMAVLRAVHDDLEDGGANGEVLAPIEAILADETAVHVKVTKGEGDKRIKKALKRVSPEAVRAEIEKDAGNMLADASLAAPLAARKVSAERLTKLRDDASALGGRLTTKTAKKGERKAATAAERAAVKAQSKKWAAIYRLLAAIDDTRLEELLGQAAARAK